MRHGQPKQLCGLADLSALEYQNFLPHFGSPCGRFDSNLRVSIDDVECEKTFYE